MFNIGRMMATNVACLRKQRISNNLKCVPANFTTINICVTRFLHIYKKINYRKVD